LEEEFERPVSDNQITSALLGLQDIREEENQEAFEESLGVLKRLEAAELHPNEDQRIVLKSCRAAKLVFIWGPPGTGKTANLAQVVRSFVVNSERVLVLAHANAAVDVAMDRIAKAFSESSELLDGKVIRVGIPQLPEVQTNEFILPEKILENRQPELVQRKTPLESRIKSLIKSLKNASRQKEKDVLAEELEGIRSLNTLASRT